jgi:exo-beta-1,3-glucanase (GH17 family)
MYPLADAELYAHALQVAEVSDFLAANSFPFWEGAPVEQAATQFNTSMVKMDEISKKYDIPVFIGETG